MHSSIGMLYEKLDDLLDQSFGNIISASHSSNSKEYVDSKKLSSYLSKRLGSPK